MAQAVSGGTDQGVHVARTFTATGQSAPAEFRGPFNVSLSGFGTASVALQRSYDAGSTWKTVEAFTADVEDVFFEPERGVLYRLNCTAWTGGSIAGRLSQ